MPGAYVLACLHALRTRRLVSLDVRRDAMQRYNERLQRDIQNTSWVAGCVSWYKTATGKVTKLVGLHRRVLVAHAHP